MQSRELTDILPEFRRMCRELELPAQQVQSTLIRRWLQEVRNQIVLGTALRVSNIKMEAKMPRRPSKPKPPGTDAADPLAAAAEMADPLAAVDPLATVATTQAAAPVVNQSSGDTLDSLAQGVDQASIARALGAVAGTSSPAGPDPVVAQALIDLKTMISGFANRFDMIEAKIAGVESKNVGLIARVEKQIDGFVGEWKVAHLATLDAIKALEYEEDVQAVGVPRETTVTPAPKPAPTANGRHQEILAILLPKLKGRPNFNYKSNPAVPQALAAAVGQGGVTCTGEEALAALASVGRVQDDGTIISG